MNDRLDMDGMGDIPDPFANAAAGALPKRPALPPSPTRWAVRRGRLAAGAAVLLYQVGWLVAVEHRKDLEQVPAATVALGLVIPLVAAGMALVAAGSRGARGLGAPAQWLALLSVLPPVLFAVATFVVNPADADADFWRVAAPCLGITAILTAGPLALGAFVFRHAFAAASTWRTAALGVASGALAAATMSVACVHGGALHVVVAHGAMLVVGGLVGALLGLRITRA
jgi:hypothetical protein